MLVNTVLRAAATVRVLATSREVLRLFIAQNVELMGWITADAGACPDLQWAAVLLGGADRAWRDPGLTKLREARFYQDPHRRYAAKIRAGLGDAAFHAAFARGAGMETADICALITGTDAGRAFATRVGDAVPFRLTAREQEVADLIAEGLSNRQIAGQFVVSPRTAEAHVQNILIKLGFTSRAQVASYVAVNRHPDGPGESPGSP